MSSFPHVPFPENEPVLDYAPGSPERADLKHTLEQLKRTELEIPLVIGGQEVRTGHTAEVVMPHNREHVLARYHLAGEAEVKQAIEAAREAWHGWSRMAWQDRAAIFLRAAELAAGPWRQTLNASTILGQSKTAHQAEIDAACEWVDFLNWNTHFAEEIFAEQPVSSPGVWNRSEYRPLEGFVYAVSPFNFTSIGGNLAAAPALMGNVVLWKPSLSAVYSNHFVLRLLEEAGLPPGVINFIPGQPGEVTDALIEHPDFAGLHFTGSTDVFRMLWERTGRAIAKYRNYPRIVGETGGKDFIVAHPSADPEALTTAMVRGAFEYQGQKCSAASRAYVPRSLWDRIRDDLIATIEGIDVGDPEDFRNFMGAVIHEGAWQRLSEAIDRARVADGVEILAGGRCDDSVGWFVSPTLIQVQDPHYETMQTELFGPILSVFVYEDEAWHDTLELVDSTSPYGLTGAVFARDRSAVREAMDRLRHAAGNFYVNDKPTGAVVGQQPFGGSRASGTNDKAGSALNLLRWVTPRSIKETLVPATDYRYPFMHDR
jgi:1-pyrroline-5-carboxylate dehydrogenase